MMYFRSMFLAAAVLFFGLQSAHAACYADYKAKRDNPLRLHYGVIELPDTACSGKKAAKNAVSARLNDAGWTLLNVVSIFAKEGLEDRKDSAGAYYLKF